jgi:hypothetical protein
MLLLSLTPLLIFLVVLVFHVTVTIKLHRVKFNYAWFVCSFHCYTTELSYAARYFPKDKISRTSHFTNQLMNSKEESPSWEANSCSATQNIPCLLWNPTFHYLVHKSLPLVSIWTQINPVHTYPSLLSKINFNFTFPVVNRSPKWSPPFMFSDLYLCLQNLFYLSVFLTKILFACYLSFKSHPPWFGQPNNAIYGEKYKLWRASFSPASHYFLSHTFKCFSHHPVPRHPQSTFFPYDKIPNITPT